MATYARGECEQCGARGDVRVIATNCCDNCKGWDYLVCDDCYDVMIYGED